MSIPAQGPLVGIKILELSEGQAGPYCGALLSDLGADVIKIEQAGGDYTRQLGPFKNGESAYFISYNRGKRGLALNLDSEEGRNIVRQLAGFCDVFIESLEPGVVENWNLDYPAIREINPSIIYGSVSCFGRTGPLSEHPGNDIVAEAMSGHTFANGFPDGPPEPIGIALTDHAGGAELGWGILSAYIFKMQTGNGQYIDVSVSDKGISMSENALITGSVSGIEWKRTGGYNPNAGPYGVFQAKDGAYAMGCGSNEMWGRITDTIGRPELHTEKGWATDPERGGNQATHMIPLLTEWGKEKQRNDIVQLMRDESRVPCGACATHKEVWQDPHYRVRKTVVDIEQPRAGKVSVASAVANKFSETPPAVQGPAPQIGEHNEEILTSLLKMPKERITELTRQGVLIQETG